MSTPLLVYFWFVVLLLFVLEPTSSSSNGWVDEANTIFPTVTTPLGQLRGTTSRSRGGKLFFSYQGIPFAQPPKRFQPAFPAKGWTGILDARKAPSQCPQMSGSKVVIGDENCLFLSVYFPHHDRCHNQSSTQLLPVIFNIHGGGYKGGSGVVGANILLDECVVLVSIQYRLGALGFMTTGDDVIPGNLGLKDQVLALQWTLSYITSFRGDPDRVTLIGWSAGGSSVAHHVTSPMSKGLFHRAIAASGCAMAPWSVQRNPHIYAQQLGLDLNCRDVTSSTSLRDCLVRKDFKSIISKQDRGDGMVVTFGPTLEPPTAACPFQTKHPAVCLRDGDFNRVPFMTGFAQDEGILILAGSAPWLTKLVDQEWDTKAPLWFLYDQLNLTKAESKRITSEIRSFYFGDKSIGLETRENLTNLYSDRYFVQSAFESVELHSKFAPSYSYVVTYKGGPSGAVTVGYEIPAVTHGDDARYILGAGESLFGTEPFNFSRTLVRHFVHFAEHGKPEESSSSEENEWKISTGRSNSFWHQLDIPEKNLKNYLDNRRKFWQNLGLYEKEFWA